MVAAAFRLYAKLNDFLPPREARARIRLAVRECRRGQAHDRSARRATHRSRTGLRKLFFLSIELIALATS